MNVKREFTEWHVRCNLILRLEVLSALGLYRSARNDMHADRNSEVQSAPRQADSCVSRIKDD